MEYLSSDPSGSQTLSPFHDYCESLILAYRDYAKDYCNICEATINEQEIYLTRFFQFFDPESLPALSSEVVQHFLFEYAKDYGPGSRKWMTFSLRSFLRFCCHKKILDSDLSIAVPAVRKRRLANVPKAIDNESTQNLLESIDLTTPLGIRDYAIIQLLNTYGIRGIQARCLKLKDIDWRNNQICFQAVKLGKPIVQHLTEEVGNSLLTYIQSSRPNSIQHSEVFLTFRKPFLPFNTSGSFSGIIARRLKVAGITLPEGTSRGTHSFRHAFATRMLANDTPLKFIADMLGHRDFTSTYLYSKVDFKALRQAAMKWPEVTL